MEQVKENITKKKNAKKVLCYFSLVILTILLFLPLAFKIIFREEKEEVPVDVVEMLSCEKAEESISSSFKNGEPQNILYKVKGDFSNKGEEEMVEEVFPDGEESSSDTSYYPLLQKIRGYSEITYDEAEGISSFRVSSSSMKSIPDYDISFSSVNNQEYYYSTIGFSCTKKVI